MTLEVSYRAKDNVRLHRIWKHMVERCCSPKCKSYQRYGGRGITICDEWRNSFKVFCKWALANGYDPNIEWKQCTIDRIDNSKGYSPDNCQWIPMGMQARNRRSNKPITFNGETHLIVEWAEIIGIPKSTLSKRLDSGWSVEDALTKPIAKHKSSRYRKKS